MARNEEPKEETPEELEIRLQKESDMRREGLNKSREAARPLSKMEKRLKALSLLEKQLADDIKPIKGQHPFVSLEGDPIWYWNADKDAPKRIQWEEFKNEKGEVTGKKPIRLYFEQLTDGDKIKINNQINSLRKKLNLN